LILSGFATSVFRAITVTDHVTLPVTGQVSVLPSFALRAQCQFE